MKARVLFVFFFCVISLIAQNKDMPINVNKLMKAYPESITGYEDGYLLLTNTQKVKYTQSQKSKTHEELLNSSEIDDIFLYEYPKGQIRALLKNHDPGRIRNEELLKAMYGVSAKEVETNLTTIVWCPKLINQKIRVTKINGVDRQLRKISDELDQYPELKIYLTSSGGYMWRKISGTNRLSSHSFGTAIDIAVKSSNYWQWDCKCKDENRNLAYKNKIPKLIVDIFEKHGFIWGGKWYHYDTMHFEYRPEFLIKENYNPHKK